MSNELHINKTEKTEEVDGVTNYGLRIPFNMQPLEPYGGPAGSFVYTMDSNLSFSKVIPRPYTKTG